MPDIKEMNQKVAEWYPVLSAPDYELSLDGSIRRKTRARGTWPGKIIARYLSEDGYPKVDLTINGRRRGLYLHTIICEVHYGPKPDGMQVNHIDGNKLNFNLSNLEYCTISQNIKHAFALGLCKFPDQRKAGNNHWNGGEKDYTCDLCGAPFRRYERRVKLHHHKFCSQKCQWEHHRGTKVSERRDPI